MGLLELVAFAKLGACPRARQGRDPGDRKTPITAADLLNDRVLPFFDEHNVKLCRMLTDAAPSIAAPHRQFATTQEGLLRHCNVLIRKSSESCLW